MLYKKEVFSGTVIEDFPQVGTRRKTQYKNGFPQGKQEEFLVESEQLVARRFFSKGKNSGHHTGWFTHGARRFHYEYNEKGEADGEFWEWHENGTPSLFALFKNGTLRGKKMWRADGTIYMNWVFSSERQYGLPGTKLCFQVRNQKVPVLPKNL